MGSTALVIRCAKCYNTVIRRAKCYNAQDINRAHDRQLKYTNARVRAYTHIRVHKYACCTADTHIDEYSPFRLPSSSSSPPAFRSAASLASASSFSRSFCVDLYRGKENTIKNINETEAELDVLI